MGKVHEPRCSICTHPARGVIDIKIADGTPKPWIAEEFGVTREALRVHDDRHVPAAISKAAENKAVLSTSFMIDELDRLLSRTDGIIEDARNDGDGRLALDGLNSLRQSLKLVAELAGKIQPEGTTAVHVHSAPEWLLIRAAVMSALVDYPEARSAVAASLAELGDGSE